MNLNTWKFKMYVYINYYKSDKNKPQDVLM